MFPVLVFFNNVLLFFFDIIFLVSFFIFFFGSFYIFLHEKSLNNLSIVFFVSQGNTLFNIFFNLIFYFFLIFYFLLLIFCSVNFISVDLFFLMLVICFLTFFLFASLHAWFYYDKSSLNDFFKRLSVFTVYCLNIIVAFVFKFLLFYFYLLFFFTTFFFNKPKEQYVLRNKSLLPVIFLKKNN